MKKILHRINLDTLGGVENIFSQILSADSFQKGFKNGILTSNRINAEIYSSISNSTHNIYYLKYYNKFKIPSRPVFLRRAHLSRIIKEFRPDIFLSWSDFANPDIIDSLKNINNIYYDHGSLWGDFDEKLAKRYLQNVNVVICNSFASKQMLKLKLGFNSAKVCKFGVRPDVAPFRPLPKTIRDKSPIRLGGIGRLKSFKGFPIALHVIKILSEKEYKVELHIAGTGTERKKIEKLSIEMGLQDKIVFHDYLTNIGDFYQFVDFFLCLSLREPFGLVNIEAASHGCITLASKVDGIPESVIDGITGYTFRAEIPLKQYPLYGGTIGKDMPRFVYDPEHESLTPPHFVSPSLVADKIMELVENPSLYENCSLQAIYYAKKHFQFSNYVSDLYEIIDSCC